MSALLRQLLFLGLAALLTWWTLLQAPKAAVAPPGGQEPIRAAAPPITVTTHRSEPDSAASAPAPPEAETEPETQAPPPPELGAPEGEGEKAAAQSEPEPEPEPAPERERRETLQNDSTLVEAPRRELSGEVRRGFATVLVAAPEDQLDIARAFGEEVVLVPRAALDPNAESPTYFRVDAAGGVETVRSRPPLESIRFAKNFIT